MGSFTPGPAKHVHDELFARCLALDDGTTKIVLVICDNLGAAREVFDEARKLITAETGLPGSAVVMTGTHRITRAKWTTPGARSSSRNFLTA